ILRCTQLFCGTSNLFFSPILKVSTQSLSARPAHRKDLFHNEKLADAEEAFLTEGYWTLIFGRLGIKTFGCNL
ncbi:MAG: hypothetical protein U9N51_04000, partial [Bacteroidota bacterium]|nr:hypothetical protein [Bacteroidota bacterium]